MGFKKFLGILFQLSKIYTKMRYVRNIDLIMKDLALENSHFLGLVAWIKSVRNTTLGVHPERLLLTDSKKKDFSEFS